MRNDFLITGESTGRLPYNKPVMWRVHFCCHCCYSLKQAVEQTVKLPLIRDAMILMWRHCNAVERWVTLLMMRPEYSGRTKRNSDDIMGSMASQITSLMIVHSTVYTGADQRKHQSSASLAFVRGIHRWPVNSPHKWPVTRKTFPFDDGLMSIP